MCKELQNRRKPFRWILFQHTFTYRLLSLSNFYFTKYCPFLYCFKVVFSIEFVQTLRTRLTREVTWIKLEWITRTFQEEFRYFDALRLRLRAQKRRETTKNFVFNWYGTVFPFFEAARWVFMKVNSISNQFKLTQDRYWQNSCISKW